RGLTRGRCLSVPGGALRQYQFSDPDDRREDRRRNAERRVIHAFIPPERPGYRICPLFGRTAQSRWGDYSCSELAALPPTPPASLATLPAALRGEGGARGTCLTERTDLICGSSALKVEVDCARK